MSTSPTVRQVRTGWWLAWQMLALIIAVIATAAVMVLSKEAPYATEYIVASFIVAVVFGLVSLVLGIWLFIEIGFLKGTQGPNRFGPDPLDAPETTQSSRARIEPSLPPRQAAIQIGEKQGAPP